MKKMSEIFELPVNHEFLEVYGPERAGVPYAEAEKHAAHAINHVDALADALDNLMRSNGGGKKDCGHDFCCTCAWDKAKAELSAYRGEQ